MHCCSGCAGLTEFSDISNDGFQHKEGTWQDQNLLLNPESMPRTMQRMHGWAGFARAGART